MIYAPSPILFFLFTAALIACAIACASANSDRRSVFFMAGSMISASGLVFLLDIPFTAEITIAAAGISGLVMLIAAKCPSGITAPADQTCAPSKFNKSAATVSLLLFAILTGAILDSNFIDTTQILSLGPQTYLNAETISSTKEMGVRLISTYIYPFILAALVIMAAIFSFITVLNPHIETAAPPSAEPSGATDDPADVPAGLPADLPAEAPNAQLAEEPAGMSPGKPGAEPEGAEQ